MRVESSETKQGESAMANYRARAVGVLSVVLVCLLASGCSIGPRNLEVDRLSYNEVIKTTTETQLLLNIVRLRYTDTPSSLSVSAIATQSEVVKNLAVVPFFGVAGGDVQAHGLAAVFPHAGVAIADRPTITLTPLDDHEFTRRLFTPMTLEGVLYLVRTTWPISTIFRLWLENLNWVSNAQTGSGPTPKQPPDFAEFLAGVKALQKLQDRGQIVFTTEEREEKQGIPVPAPSVTAGTFWTRPRMATSFARTRVPAL